MDQYIQQLMSYNSNYDAQLLEKAYLKATEMHKDQKRRSGEPYIIHPKAVAVILADIGMDDHTLAAGLLHDVVEDTSYSLEDLRADFGDDIAMMVDGVTKLTNLVYDNQSKEERQAENIRKMFLAMSKDIRILVIKLADRLHNLRTIQFMPYEKRMEKCRESLEIYAPLAARLGIYAFKFEMEDISFMNLEPEAYRHIDEVMTERRRKNANEIENIIADIRVLLDELGIRYEVYGRNKHYYSIYKKMVIQHRDLDEIFDLTAVRIIVDSVKDCYAALGAVHTKWTPIPGRFKDYIAMPKPNQYQSLHTTVIGQNGSPFEIQIRTHEMHMVAEYGIAAHWKYKEGISAEDDEAKLAWLRQTLEWQQESSDSTEFVNTLKMELFSSQVFVFTPKGDIVELPAGSTPLDFAFKIHTGVGIKTVGAKINGKMVPIDYVLHNGEIVDIVTSNSSKGPSPDWLKIVKTNSAKNKIRQVLKKENRPENADKGKDMIEKALKRKGLDLEKVMRAPMIQRAAKEMEYQTPEDLYNAVSYGGREFSRAVKLLEDYRQEEIQAEIKRQEEQEQKLRNLEPKKAKESTGGVTVKGVDNLFVRFARCCSPIPGDEIIGFTTKGRGISIHRKDCINIISLPERERGRLIEVEWEESDSNLYFDASIHITAEDRKGLMVDISKVCEEMDINITGVNLIADKRDSLAHMDMTLSLNNTKDIVKLMNRFRAVKSVVDVYRNNF